MELVKLQEMATTVSTIHCEDKDASVACTRFGQGKYHAIKFLSGRHETAVYVTLEQLETIYMCIKSFGLECDADENKSSNKHVEMKL